MQIKKTTGKKLFQFSNGNPGDLTYEYSIIGRETEDIKNLIDNKGEFSKKSCLLKNH